MPLTFLDRDIHTDMKPKTKIRNKNSKIPYGGLQRKFPLRIRWYLMTEIHRVFVKRTSWETLILTTGVKITQNGAPIFQISFPACSSLVHTGYFFDILKHTVALGFWHLLLSISRIASFSQVVLLITLYRWFFSCHLN